MPREHPKTTRSRQHFNHMAAQYDRLFVPRLGGYDTMHDALLAMLPARPSLRVLELGCGTGNLTRKLLARSPDSRVVAYDLSPQMLAEARQKLAAVGEHVEWIEADMGRVDFAGPFDAVISAIAVHHVPPRAKPALFRRLYDALRPGGRLVIADTFRAATPALDATYRQLRAVAPAAPDDNAAYEAFRAQAGSAGGSATHLERYLGWMRQAGFTGVDCVWKYFSLAIVYGERPQAA